MVDTLDLDALVPEPKKIKLNGKFFDVLPLTIKQLINLAKLEQKLINIKNEDEVKPLILETLKPIIPELNDVDFTYLQLMALLKFAQASSLPKENKAAEDYSPKKKIDSAKESPTSSTSTPPTPSTKP